ncbi:MAG: energy transducer TonB [Pseudomonadota bacterium]
MKTLIRLAILALALGSAWWIREQLAQSPHYRMEERQWVKLIDEPPPPETPEPEPMEEPPESEIQEEVVEEPAEAEAATDDQLGIDEEGGAGADSFGLRAKKGGKDLLQSEPSGHRGRTFLAYGGTLASQLERRLMIDSKLRDKHYVAVVRVWISPAGKISQCEIEQSSGSRETDARIVELVSSFTGPLAAPPDGMPQPIRIRIRSTRAS